MSDDRRHPHRPSRRAGIAAAAAAGALLLGGVAVAAAEDGEPAVTDVGLESTTTADVTTTEAPAPEATVPVVDPQADPAVPGDPAEEPVVEADELDDGTDGDAAVDPTTEGGEPEGEHADHPDNHGAAVSEAARDHSHDDEAGNHGRYVSGVARGDGSEGDGPAATPGKGKGRSGR